MAVIRVVSDNDLGEIARKYQKLVSGVLEGSIEKERALFILDLATMGIPKVREEERADGTYALQCKWTWDKSHYEMATISFEACDREILPEQMLNPDISKQKKERLLKMLKKIFMAQVSFTGSFRILRVYRVLSTRYFGFDPHHGVDGTLERLNTVDAHLILKPLFDFDENGKPIPCVIG